MPVKTFPLVFDEKEHAELKKIAKKRGMTLKEFILKAIEEYKKEVNDHE